MKESLNNFIARSQKLVDAGLDRYLPAENAYPQSIHKSMRYSVFAGGKRVRPALALGAYEFCGGNACAEPIQLACCALEMLHAFSLIHDDLPCMDDDDLRRGKPTNHRVFGEAIAVLGGDALCIHAFELLGRTGNCRVITEIGKALGTGGMLGGQVVDVESEGTQVDTTVLEYIHTHKTAALITASIRTGALLANAGERELDGLSAYGRNVGLAFQVADDILDIVGTTEQIGKDAKSDLERGKITYPALYGMERSREIARTLVAAAKETLRPFGPKAELFCAIADYVIERVN